MCRHLAYLGPATALSTLLAAGSNSLITQSYRPRLQTHGVVNADGWGVGWFPPGGSAPARYRSAMPIWADEFPRDVAPHVEGVTAVAAVRSASPPFPTERSGNAPFSSERHLFSHNGLIPFTSALSRDRYLARASAARREQVLGPTDSEAVFAVLLTALDDGESPLGAMCRVVSDLADLPRARVNLLLASADEVLASRCGDTLFLAAEEQSGSSIVASEPLSDEPKWIEVEDRTLVSIDRRSTSVHPL